MLVIWLPLLVCLLGLVVYMVSTNAKVQSLALHAYWTGLLVTLLDLAGRAITVR